MIRKSVTGTVGPDMASGGWPEIPPRKLVFRDDNPKLPQRCPLPASRPRHSSRRGHLNIDLDVVLSILAGALCAALRKRLPGYATVTPDTLQRRFIETHGKIINSGDHITIRLNRHTRPTPVHHPHTIVPWWNNREPHFEYTLTDGIPNNRTEISAKGCICSMLW